MNILVPPPCGGAPVHTDWRTGGARTPRRSSGTFTPKPNARPSLCKKKNILCFSIWRRLREKAARTWGCQTITIWTWSEEERHGRTCIDFSWWQRSGDQLWKLGEDFKVYALMMWDGWMRDPIRKKPISDCNYTLCLPPPNRPVLSTKVRSLNCFVRLCFYVRPMHRLNH